MMDEAKAVLKDTFGYQQFRHSQEQVIEAVDERFATLTVDDLLGDVNYFGMEYPENLGSVLQRTNNHYLFHMGEVAAVRQLLDHTGYPEVMAEEGAMDYYQSSKLICQLV